ncbi:MAG: T9SS type A sorting domain-containing protein, partial [Bacteroidales bacterium]|nr:T9SS type A sorting domain-containing protein [Bacteroidales bacterium]
MKKTFLVLALLSSLNIAFAQSFSNYFSGYFYSISLKTSGEYVFIGGTNKINVFKTDGSFVETKYATGSVTSIAKAESGKIYFGVSSGQILVYDNGNWSEVFLNDEMTCRYIAGIAIDQNDNIWITTHCSTSEFSSISSFNGETWQNIIGFGDTITIQYADQIIIDSNNYVYAGFNASGGTTWSYGIVRIGENDTTIYNYTNSNYQVACRHSSFLDMNNNPWFGGCYKSISYFDGENWTMEANDEIFHENDAFYAIGQQNNSFMLFGTTAGLYVQNENSWEKFTTEDMLLFDEIRGIGTDENSNIWITANNNENYFPVDYRYSCLTNFNYQNSVNYFPNTHIGNPRNIKFIESDIYTFQNSPLSIFDGENWNIDITQNDFFNLITNDICKDNSGNLWIGTNNGLYKINISQQVEHITDINGNAVANIKALGTLNNKIWLVSSDNKLYKSENGTWTQIEIPIGYSLAHTTKMFIRSENEIWFTILANSAIKYDTNGWQRFSEEQGFLPNQSINDICFHGDSTWFATRYGAVLMHNETLNFYCNDSSSFSGYSNLQSVHIDKTGLLWFGNMQGAMTFDGQNINYLQPSNLAEPIYTIREDDNNNIWFCGGKSLSKYHYEYNRIENNKLTASHLKSYPNPATNNLNIELPKEIINDIVEIYSTTGSLVLQQKVQTGTNNIN